MNVAMQYRWHVVVHQGGKVSTNPSSRQDERPPSTKGLNNGIIISVRLQSKWLMYPTKLLAVVLLRDLYIGHAQASLRNFNEYETVELIMSFNAS